jgi:hypothetical protein
MDKIKKDYEIIKKELKDYKKYFIHQDQIKDIQYLVYLNEKKKELYIYTLPKYKKILKELLKDDIPMMSIEKTSYKNKKKYAYTRLIEKYKYKKIYKGSSEGKSIISDGYKIKNNGFLLNISNNKYILISDIGIYEIVFKEKILKLLTPVNEPVIIGEDNLYTFDLDKGKNKNILKSVNKENIKKKDYEDVWYKLQDKELYKSKIIKSKELFKNYYYKL